MYIKGIVVRRNCELMLYLDFGIILFSMQSYDRGLQKGWKNGVV